MKAKNNGDLRGLVVAGLWVRLAIVGGLMFGIGPLHFAEGGDGVTSLVLLLGGAAMGVLGWRKAAASLEPPRAAHAAASGPRAHRHEPAVLAGAGERP